MASNTNTTSDNKLKAAAEDGDINLLYSVIEEDPQVLDHTDSISFVETPLHVAASFGNIGFAVEIMRLKPSFAWKLNPQGFTPMHLAMQHGHKRMVLRFVDVNKELVRVKGREGVTPLHFASQIGEVDLLGSFLLACPDSIEDVSIRSETALHIAVRYQEYEALQLLVGWLKRTCQTSAMQIEKTILNWKDDAGNTILHVSALLNDSKNKAQPEGSIAEGYLAEESLTFCSLYIEDIETRFNKPKRVCDDPIDNETSFVFSIFPQIGKLVGACSMFNLTPMQKLQAHRYVLLNCTMVTPFVDHAKGESNVSTINVPQEDETIRLHVRRESTQCWTVEAIDSEETTKKIKVKVELCRRNKEIRSKQVIPHTGGSKANPRRRNELLLETGKVPSRGQLYIETHKRKDGSFVNDATKTIVEQIEVGLTQSIVDESEVSSLDVVGRVLGPEHSGRVRCMGLGVVPSNTFRNTRLRVSSLSSYSSGVSFPSSDQWQEKYNNLESAFKAYMIMKE
uniref:Ankyrin repeat-containing protein At5g02620 family n=1 Tax=Cajanus cajan TaxID=3821 RepID=A0A151RJJ5_CAJCA|nr:Ankyrin repeat-containing protein At5g02620 family [Cajanus cajan]